MFRKPVPWNQFRHVPRLGGAAAARQNLEIADLYPETETSVLYEFLQDVRRVVAAFVESLLSRSSFNNLRIPPNNVECRHDLFLQCRPGCDRASRPGTHSKAMEMPSADFRIPGCF